MKLFSALLFLFLVTGCIQIDENITLYVHANGEMDFVAYLDNIHSDDKDPKKKATEEKNFLSDFKSGKALKKPLEKMGGTQVRQDLYRNQTPYAGIISGHFKKMENFWEAFDFNGNDKDRIVRLQTGGGKSTLTFRLPAKTDETATKHEFPRNIKFVHSTGKFTSAEGFAISIDGKTARLDLSFVESMMSKREPYQISLSW